MSPEMIWKGLPSSSNLPCATTKRWLGVACCASAGDTASSRTRVAQTRRKPENLEIMDEEPRGKSGYRKPQHCGYFGQAARNATVLYVGLACSPTRRLLLHPKPECVHRSSKFALRLSRTHRSRTAAARDRKSTRLNSSH